MHTRDRVDLGYTGRLVKKRWFVVYLASTHIDLGYAADSLH